MKETDFATKESQSEKDVIAFYDDYAEHFMMIMPSIGMQDFQNLIQRSIF